MEVKMKNEKKNTETINESTYETFMSLQNYVKA